VSHPPPLHQLTGNKKKFPSIGNTGGNGIIASRHEGTVMAEVILGGRRVGGLTCCQQPRKKTKNNINIKIYMASLEKHEQYSSR